MSYFGKKLGWSLVLITVLFSLLIPSQVSAVVVGSNVIQNGDAASGNLTGWTIKSGDAGLWGTWNYSNYGTLFDCTVYSARESYAYQDIGVSDINFSTAVVSLSASARLMSSTMYSDQYSNLTAELQVLFLNSSGSQLSMHKVGLATSEMGQAPSAKSLNVPQIPSGTATIRVRMYFNASVPDGTMAYGDFDDISVILSDGVPPVPGNGGLINTNNPTNSSVGLAWFAASDGVTASSNLQYKVVRSSSDNLHSLSTIESNGTTVQNWTSNLTSKIVSGLAEEQTYYFNVIVRDAAGNRAIYNGTSYTTGYTPVPATVTTQAVTDVTTTSATGSGNVTGLGKASPTQHGVVWGTASGPTVALDTKTTQGPVLATGLFTSSMTGLTPDTTYYVRAYATNEAGTSYGDEVSFTTLPLVVSAPTASATTGSTIKKDATITLSAEEGATIYYTTALNDATPADPDGSSSSVVNGGEVSYPALTCGDVLKIKAIAAVAGKIDSAVTTFSYTVQPVTELTLTGITVSDKTYDGNTEATGDFTGASLSGILGTDVVILSGTPSASFLDAKAGENKTVMVSGYGLTGVDAEYYTLNTTLTSAANISKKALTAGATASSKRYDGNTATTGTISLDGIVGSDDVAATGSFAFVDAEVGDGKTVNVTSITLSGADAGNYTVSTTASTTANISKADIAGVTFENGTATYDGTLKSIEIGGTLPVGASVSYSGNTGTNAGTYSATASISGGTNYNDLTLNATLTIDKATLVATVGDYQKTYGYANPGFAVTVTGFVSGETAATAAGYVVPTASSLASATTDVGTATITINGGVADNYTFDVSDTGTLTIAAKELTATAIANDKTYDGTTAASGSVSLDGIIGSDDVTATGTFAFVDAEAGDGKTVNVSGLTLSGPKAGNYIVSITASTTANISKADISGITFENSTVTYDGTMKSVVIGGTSPAGASVSYSGHTGINAGTYNATASISGGTNYNDLLLNSTLTIDKATLVATVGDYQKTYGDANPGFAVTVTGFVSGQTAATAAGYVAPTASSLATATTDVGTATITISGGEAENYIFDVSDIGTLAIVAKELTAIGIANDKTYDGSTATTGSIGLDGIVGSDDVTATGTFAFADADAGAGKTVNVSGITLSGTKAGNYTVSSTASTTAIISKANITGISFENGTVTYDGTAKSILINGTLPTGASVSYSGNSATNAGTYNATAFISGGTNYNDLTLNATLTIDKATLVATVGDYQKTYGDANPDFGVFVTGFVNGETAATAAGYVAPTASSLATAATDVGLAIITVSGGAADNYTFDVDDEGTLTIVAKTLTATATADNKTYDGSTVATGSISLDGIVGSDDVSPTGAFTFADADAGDGKPVNVTGITLSGTKSGNYTVNTTATTSAGITKADITDISFENSAVTYDGTVRNILIDGTLPAGAGVSYTDNSGTNVGTYNATAVISGGTNYNDLTLNATLTINKAQLVATVGNYEKTYGESNPGFTVTVTGFVIGETATTAAGYVAPTASSRATSSTDAGSATISISGGAADDYTFDVSDTGTLTISPKRISATGITAHDKLYDGCTRAMLNLSGAQLVGQWAGDDVGLNTSNANGEFADSAVEKDKTVTVTGLRLTGGDASNYTLAPYTTTASIVDLATIEQPATSEVEIIVNGATQEGAGTATTEVVDGRTVTTVSIDSAGLSTMLGQQGEQAVVTVPVNTGAEVIVGELNGQMVRDMELSSAVLQVQTDSVTYTLPAAQINIADVAEQIGAEVSLQDIQVRVQVAEPPEDTVRIVDDAADEGNYSIVVSPVEFVISCTHGDQTVEVDRFNAYVERTVAIPDGVDPSKITTGVVLNEDGTFSHVPTTIIVIDGRYYARINSLTNSVYSVIWNPLTFQDIRNHWAEGAVNDMASRLVMQPDSSGNFGPSRAITRGEFAATIVRALGLQPGTGESPFVDVKPGDEYYGYILTAREYRIMGGYNDGTFRANRQITREEAMSMIVSAMRVTKLSSGLQPGEGEQLLSTYTDGSRVSSWARGVVASCLQSGIMGGRPGMLIDPKASITRGEVAVVVQRLLRKSGLI